MIMIIIMMTIKNYEKFYKLECNTLLKNTLLRTDGTLLIEPKKKKKKERKACDNQKTSKLHKH